MKIILYDHENPTVVCNFVLCIMSRCVLDKLLCDWLHLSVLFASRETSGDCSTTFALCFLLTSGRRGFSCLYGNRLSMTGEKPKKEVGVIEEGRTLRACYQLTT